MVKRTFIRYCRDCNELFQPEGKFSKVCDRCKDKIHKRRKFGTQPIILNKQTTSKN